ncbi:MAG: tetratricopeptide repeat protein [Phycisphaerae bacterium]|nr:tetratricopeptide repeat protein [Phycisphaerae bacterium]
MSIAGTIAAELERLMNAGRPAQAEATVRRALARSPRDPGLNQVMALFLLRTGRPQQAVFFAERAAAGAPDAAELRYTLGLSLTNTPRRAEAVAALRRAAELDPSQVRFHNALAQVLLSLGDTEPAEAALSRARQLAPDDTTALCLLARLYNETGRAEESVVMLTEAIRRLGDSRDLLAFLCTSLNYSARATPGEIFAAHARLGATALAAPAAVLPDEPRADGPLRVGLLGGDFRQHSVAYFLEPLLESRDRAAFHVTIYNQNDSEDAVTGRFQSLADAWHTVTQFSDAELFTRIRSDRIDVLMDLLGVLDTSRFDLLARRPAPVQVAYLAYPNTCGLRAVGHRIVDALTDPPGSEPLATESLERMPTGCFLCYRPDPRAPDVRPRPPQTPVTFASFNNTAKISSRTVELWAAVLRAAPGSDLLLKATHLHHPPVQRALAARFAAHGIDPGRLRFAGRTEDVPEHLALYQQADIALDTFPYHGTTTTCEALWMGLPVVSLTGDRHAARVGLSLLTAIGRPEWACADDAAFVRTAVGLSSDRAVLAAHRAELCDRVRRSVLCDAPRQSRAFFDLLASLRGRGTRR